MSGDWDSIRAALETRLNSIASPLPTAWENVPFTQPITAFQRAYILPANSATPSFGDNLSMESGLLKISLCYPEGTGPAAALARALSIRAWFPRGLSVTSGGITVRISSKPSIAPALYEPGLYVVPVTIPFFCYLP